MKLILIMIIAYLAGSVNFSIILFRLLGKADPRASYSGNAGVTNVYRQAGPAWAAVVLLLDVGRAVLVALLAKYALGPGQVPWAGLALIIGNSFPCFHEFMGGKGVANYLGFTAIVTPAGAAIAAIAWVLSYLYRREPFIASFVMILVLAVGSVAAGGPGASTITGTALTAFLIVFNHRKNIRGLIEKNNGEGRTEEKEGD